MKQERQIAIKRTAESQFLDNILYTRKWNPFILGNFWDFFTLLWFTVDHDIWIFVFEKCL